MANSPDQAERSDGDAPSEFHRPIRSFVLRKGRLTPAQQRALDELMPRFGVPAGDGPLDFNALFDRQAPVILEIGFGNGESMLQMAGEAPDSDFIGIEVHPPGVGRLLLALEHHGTSNVRVAMTDAVSFLSTRIADATVDGVRIFFPDPWPKKRHHKRRLVQLSLIEVLADRMKKDAVLHLATDWSPYAEHMVEVLSGCRYFENLSRDGDFCARPSWRPQTKYELRGIRLGHPVRDLLYRRNAS